MRTNIDIDDKLMAKAMKASGSNSKRETVEKALMLLLRQNGQRKILKFEGKVDWQGDLDAWRRD